MRRHVDALVLGASVSLLLAAQIIPAAADPGDALVDDVVSQADQVASGVTGAVSGMDSSTGSGVTQTSTAGSNGASDPSESDHAGAAVAELFIAGNEAVVVGGTHSQIDDDASTSSDVTLLALGGQEIVGSHSDSNGSSESSNDALAPICTGSGGQLCLGLLYAKSSATEDDGSSSADADGAVAYVCAGGSNTDPEAECNGPVDLSVAESHSTIHRDKGTGATSADAESDLIEACAGGRAADRSCSGAGVNAVHSESHSDAPQQNAPGSASRDSYLLGLSLGGEHHEVLGDEQSLSVPPDCPDTGAVCAHLNEGETHIRIGGASADQDALHLVVKLPNLGNLIELRLGHTETSVDNPGAGDEVEGTRRHRPEAKAKRPPTVAAGNLPFTGGNALGWVTLGLMMLATGAAGWTRSRVRSNP